MTIHIAFLRAINVGGHTIAMARLRALVEELGFAPVESFIASGNLRFSAPGSAMALERRLADHLERKLGYPVPAFIRTPGFLRALPEQLPGQSTDPAISSYVGFLHSRPTPAARRRLVALDSAIDTFATRGREVYWLSRKTIGQSKVTGRQLAAALGQPTTFRSLSSLRRLIATWCQPE